MDEIQECEIWIENLCQKLESFWRELEEYKVWFNNCIQDVSFVSFMHYIKGKLEVFGLMLQDCCGISMVIFQEPVSYYGRVGESVKQLYSDAVQEIPLRHSNSMDLVETSTSSTVAFNGNTVDSYINKLKEAPLVPTILYREQITSEISGCSVEEGDSLIKNNSNKGFRVHLNSFTNSQEDVGSSKRKNSSESFKYSGCVEKKYDADRSAKILNELSENYFNNRSEEEGIFCDASSVTDGSIFEDADWDIDALIMYNEYVEEKCDDDGFAKISNETPGNQFINTMEEEGILCNASLETDASIFEDADWDIPYTVDLNVDIGKKIEGEPSMNLEEKKTLLKTCTDEFEIESNNSIAHQSSKLESSVTCNQSKEENTSHTFDSGLLSEKLSDSSNSSFRNFTVEPDKINCNPTESVDFSVSPHDLSLCGSFTVLGCDRNNEASTMPFSKIGMPLIHRIKKKKKKKPT